MLTKAVTHAGVLTCSEYSTASVVRDAVTLLISSVDTQFLAHLAEASVPPPRHTSQGTQRTAEQLRRLL